MNKQVIFKEQTCTFMRAMIFKEQTVTLLIQLIDIQEKLMYFI